MIGDVTDCDIALEHCLVVDQLRGIRLSNGSGLFHRDPGLKRS